MCIRDRWKDKALYDTGSYEDVNGASQRWTMNMTGAQANHMGIELDFIADSKIQKSSIEGTG